MNEAVNKAPPITGAAHAASLASNVIVGNQTTSGLLLAVAKNAQRFPATLRSASPRTQWACASLVRFLEYWLVAIRTLLIIGADLFPAAIGILALNGSKRRVRLP